ALDLLMPEEIDGEGRGAKAGVARRELALGRGREQTGERLLALAPARATVGQGQRGFEFGAVLAEVGEGRIVETLRGHEHAARGGGARGGGVPPAPRGGSGGGGPPARRAAPAPRARARGPGRRIRRRSANRACPPPTGRPWRDRERPRGHKQETSKPA